MKRWSCDEVEYNEFYNWIPLALQLLANRTYCTGVMQLDRIFLPHEVKTVRFMDEQELDKQGLSVGLLGNSTLLFN